jgi:hypothetical protein
MPAWTRPRRASDGDAVDARSPVARLGVTPAALATVAATLVALASAWHSGSHVWSRIAGDYSAFSAYTAADRLHAPTASVGLEGQIFDWYSQHLTKGDRFYVQVDAEHDPGFVRMVAGYYLLPAVEVATPSQATVVLSYWTNPNALGIHYLTQTEAGLQPIYVSRIGAP